jgi:hypothetical protein
VRGEKSKFRSQASHKPKVCERLCGIPEQPISHCHASKTLEVVWQDTLVQNDTKTVMRPNFFVGSATFHQRPVSSIFVAAGHCFLGFRIFRALLPGAAGPSILRRNKTSTKLTFQSAGGEKKSGACREGGGPTIHVRPGDDGLVFFHHPLVLFWPLDVHTGDAGSGGVSVPPQTTNDAGRGCHHLDDDEWLTNKSSCVSPCPRCSAAIEVPTRANNDGCVPQKKSSRFGETTRAQSINSTR